MSLNLTKHYGISIRLIILVVSVIFLKSCSLGYYKQAAVGHLTIIKQRQSIDTLLSDKNKKNISDVERNKLELANRIRSFAANSLALPVDNTYSSYVNIHRPYVVWNVFAAEEFSVSPKQWCYPIIGCASYRGYYNADNAHRYAERLQKQDIETYVGGVRAYSTLGWFDDPVLSTFIELDDLNFIALLVHEITHRVAYAKNDTAFNESFATAIELFGVETWLNQNLSSIDPEIVEQFYTRRAMREAFISEVLSTRNSLNDIYNSTLNAEEKRAAKQRTYRELSQTLTALDQRFNQHNLYARWAEDANNAKIAPVNSYHQWVRHIRLKLDSMLASYRCRFSNLGDKICQQQLQTFYREIKQLSKISVEERKAVLENWGSLKANQ